MAVSVASAGLVLLAAACGGSASRQLAPAGPSPSASSASEQGNLLRRALAFSACMRSNGVPSFPDASSSNETSSGLPKVGLHQLGVSSSRFEAAKGACARLLQHGGQVSSAASQRTLRSLVGFAVCMRSHGVSGWPDPIPVSPEAPAGVPPSTFDLQGLPGLDSRSFAPQTTTALHECFRLTRLTDAEVPWSG